MDYIVELAIFILSVIIAGFSFIMKRLHKRMDKNEEDLTNHRVEDARLYITREELDTKMYHLKDDIRGMISPIRTSVENIEKFLREHNKN